MKPISQESWWNHTDSNTFCFIKIGEKLRKISYILNFIVKRNTALIPPEICERSSGSPQGVLTRINFRNRVKIVEILENQAGITCRRNQRGPHADKNHSQENVQERFLWRFGGGLCAAKNRMWSMCVPCKINGILSRIQAILPNGNTLLHVIIIRHWI